MFSLSICDRVRFKSKKGFVFTSLPVDVEFGKITSGKEFRKYVKIRDWNKINSGDWNTRQVRFK